MKSILQFFTGFNENISGLSLENSLEKLSFLFAIKQKNKYLEKSVLPEIKKFVDSAKKIDLEGIVEKL
jgi:hypothetical protein